MFVSDKFNHGVQRLLDKHKIDARLCNPHGQTILQTTAQSRPSRPSSARVENAAHPKSATGATSRTKLRVCYAALPTSV